MEQSNFLPGMNDYNIRKKSLVMCKIVETKGDFQLEASMLAEEVPSFVHKTTKKFGYKEFASDDFLYPDGAIKSVSAEDSFPLANLFAYWHPNDHFQYDELLKNYYQKVMRAEIEEPKAINPEINTFLPLDVEDFAKLISAKKVIFFTGAGISMSKEIPNLDEFSSFLEELFYPIEKVFNDILSGETSTRLRKVKEFNDLIIHTEPSTSHWVIAEICKNYNITLATGNFDGLHEKTGIKAIFQNSDEVVIPDLDKYDVLVTIGLSENGIGEVADVFRESDGNKIIIAINTVLPKYITDKDYFIEGDTDHILTRLWEIIKEKNGVE